MSAEVDVRSTGSRRALDAAGVLLCVVVDVAAVYAVFQSPYGTLLILDDSPPQGYVLVPVLAGAAVGALQRVALGTPTTVVAAVVVALLGAVSLFFVFPAGSVAVGCVLGAVAARAVRRRTRRGASIFALIASVVVGTFAASYGVTRPHPPYVPLLQVSAVRGGPSVVIDPQERGTSFPMLGTLTDVEGCLGVVSDRTGSVVVAWPKGTTAAGTPYELTYRGRTFRVGDSIYLPRGGLITLPVDLDAYAPDLPASCRGVALLLAG